MSDGGQTVPRITKAEHIGPADTGDNIEAKRVVPYSWNGTAWTRGISSGIFTLPFDTVVINYTDSSKSTISTVVSKLSGATQETITLTVGSTSETYART